MDSFSMVAATGSYQFKIDHYKTKDMDIEKRITSPTFRVGLHDWSIWYYPKGYNKDDNGKYLSVYLEFKGGLKDVAVKYGFVLLDKRGNISSTSLKESSYTFKSDGPAGGWTRFLERTKLEKTYVKNGYFVLQVFITVKDIKGAPTQNMCPCEHFKQFREDTKQTDVTFDVDGKKFSAHRLILAAHSPVFKAQLFSWTEDCMMIKEMTPSVFEAMLDFMYNGSLSIDDEIADCKISASSTSFLQLLVAAADHYAVDKLKAICERKLVESISLDTVLTFLELAEKHNCSALKKECLWFIVAKDNIVSLVSSEEYIKLMHNYPSLLGELKETTGKWDKFRFHNRGQINIVEGF